jgi:hypothetical protein
MVELDKNGMPINLSDLVLLQAIIDGHEPGLFTLKEMFPEQWPHFKRQRYYGRLFKRSVEQGLITGIYINGQRSNRSWEYRVL